MKITVTKKKEIDVNLTDEQCDEILTRHIKNHYLEYYQDLTEEDTTALSHVYTFFSGKPLDLLER